MESDQMRPYILEPIKQRSIEEPFNQGLDMFRSNIITDT